MSDTAALTLRIPPALKEKLKAVAEQQQTSLSQTVTTLLESALSQQQKSETNSNDSTKQASFKADADVPALSAKEIKALRKLLRKK